MRLRFVVVKNCETYFKLSLVCYNYYTLQVHHKDKRTTLFYIEPTKIDVEVPSQRIISILKDRRRGWDIHDYEIEAHADVLFPGVIKFFSSDE